MGTRQTLQNTMESSQSDKNVANGTSSMSSGTWNMEVAVAARPLGMKLYPKNDEWLQIVSVNPEGVGNVVGMLPGDRIVAVNGEHYGESKRLLHNILHCKLPMTLQVLRPDNYVVFADEQSSLSSYSRSISIDSSASCNLCAVCNLENTNVYVNPCYHDVCHACYHRVNSRSDVPQKCPICRFPVKSAHPLSHYHIPSQSVITKVKPFVEMNLKWPPAILDLIFQFLTYKFHAGQRVLARDKMTAAWTECIVTCANPLSVTLHGEVSKDWPDVLPVNEPRPEIFQPNRSISTEWPWPRPLNFNVSDKLSVYSKKIAPKWFRGRKYYQKLERLENELFAELPCRPEKSWSRSARPNDLFENTFDSKPRRSEISVTSSANCFSSSSISLESFGVCGLSHIRGSYSCSVGPPSVSRVVVSRSMSKQIDVSDQETKNKDLRRMRQIIDFVYRAKARKPAK